MDYLDTAVEQISRECKALGYEPAYLSSTDPEFEPDYLVLEPGLCLCIDPMNEVCWLSAWDKEQGRYGVGMSVPVVATDWVMREIKKFNSPIVQLNGLGIRSLA